MHWTHLNCLEEGGFPALLWDTLKDFGYTAYPEYSTHELLTTGQLLHWEVKVKIPKCPTHPTWEEWEVKAQGLNLALTTFCEKHADLVASTAAKVIPLLKQHSGHGIECEAFLSAQDNHHRPDLVTSVRFSKAMYDTYHVVVGEKHRMDLLGPTTSVATRTDYSVRTMCGSRTGGWSLPCVMSV
jgi:hypothetical protein